MTFLDEREALPPAGPVEEAHTSGDKRRIRQECPECHKTVGNLPSHMSQKHGIRGANEGKGDRSPRARPGPGRLPSIRTELEATYRIAAQMWMIKDPVCGGMLDQQAGQLAEAWDVACQANPRLHKFLAGMMGGGALMGVMVAHLPLAVVVVQHHGPAAQAARRAQEEAAWLAAEQAAEAAAANGADPTAAPWFPPGSVTAEEAYGPHTPGSADSAR